MSPDMKRMTFGKLLENARVSREISKTRLCKGICTITALTRYEQDERIPDKFLADFLLERAGVFTYKYEFITSEEEFHYSTKRKVIDDFIYNNQLEIAFDEIKKYENSLKESDNLHRQYILLKKAIIQMKYMEIDEAMELIKQGLLLTQCDAYKKEMLFSNVEMQLCYKLSECLCVRNESEKAHKILVNLKNNIEKFECGNKTNDYYPYILYRLAQLENECFNFGKAYEYLCIAETYMLKEYKIHLLKDIMELKEDIGRKVRMKEEKTKEKDFILALGLLELTGDRIITKEGMEFWENTVKQQL